MRLALFWSMLVLILYTYVGFPLLIFLRGWLQRRPHKSAEITPQVSLLIAAYNEVESIKARLDNILSLDYPRDRLEVIVASDGSNDGTDEIVRTYAEQGIRLLSLPRQGKTSALNSAAASAHGEILVFSDANTQFAPDAVQALVRPFVDPEVGGVAGDQRYIACIDVDGSSIGERSYWNLDRILKQYQSQAGSITSATGAIYAIRRSLFRPIPAGVMDDFVVSANVIAQGYRLVFSTDAIAYEPVATSSRGEFQRKVRVIGPGLQGVLAVRSLLNPFQYGFYSFQLFWHKVLRRLIVFPFLLLLLVSASLWHRPIYRLITLVQLAFYGLAGLGMALKGTRLGQMKLFALPFYFCMVYIAAMVATFNLLRGKQINRWEPQRQTTGRKLT